LSTRRQLDRVYSGFARIPFPECRRKAHTVSKKLEKEGYVYSSIIANFIELNALDWMVQPEEKKPVLQVVTKKMRNLKDSALWCLLYMHLAATHCDILEVRKSLSYVRKFRKLIYRLKSTYYMKSFGHILTGLGRYKEAIPYYRRALQQSTDPDDKKRLMLVIATFGYGLAGDYEQAKKMLTRTKVDTTSARQQKTAIALQAFIAFGKGDLEKSTDWFRESLKAARKEEFYNEIYVTSSGLAAIAAALNKRREAETYLKKYLPLMDKGKLTRESLLLKQMLGMKKPISKELLYIPPLRLLSLLVQANRTQRTGDYRKAFKFAQQQNLLGLLHRWIVFFPKPVQALIEKNKPTGLPQSILGFPVFNQSVPVYHVKFLGRSVIMRNQQYVRARLSPRENAFFVHLALRAGAPGKFILVRDLHNNFWPRGKKPADLLVHLVAQLKRKLIIPGRLLSISSSYPEPRFVNRGIYVTTDYGEFETLMSQVRTLEQANEWAYAKRDYVKALALLRGEPFKKMYDAWSESMRSVVLQRYEDSVAQFVKACTQHDAEQDARKVLEKCAMTIPHSTEIKRLHSDLKT
jgi:tetratricopeptide (TPR) repeat protein